MPNHPARPHLQSAGTAGAERQTRAGGGIRTRTPSGDGTGDMPPGVFRFHHAGTACLAIIVAGIRMVTDVSVYNRGSEIPKCPRVTGITGGVAHEIGALTMQDYSISPRGKVRYLEADRGFGTPCWEWQMHCDNSGYGRIRIGRLHTAAHRYYFELYRGPVGDNLQLDHLCRNRKCVNPDHLEVVTMVENIRRGNVAKLTPVQVSEILALKGHETAKEVGQRFGVVRSTISRIWSGDRWSGILQQEHDM